MGDGRLKCEGMPALPARLASPEARGDGGPDFYDFTLGLSHLCFDA